MYQQTYQQIPPDTNRPPRSVSDKKTEEILASEGVLGPCQTCLDENLVPQEGLEPPTPSLRMTAHDRRESKTK